MERRVSRFARVFLLVSLAFSFLPVAVAQEATTISIVNHDSEIHGLLQQGWQLEIDRRWGDALAHYEEAVRRFPHDADLQRRFDISRLHYELGRRYGDRSFQQAVAALPGPRALDLYNQVLLKIETHYVDAPHWKELVARGTDNFEVALNEPAFINIQLPHRNPEALKAFRAELRRLMHNRTVATRSDARDAVATVAGFAQERLGMRPTAVVLEYLCGATNTLDPYSSYLTSDQLNEVYCQIDGNFVGLGIELKAEDGKLRIVRVIPGSPAQLAGILDEDLILAVDGQSTASMNIDQAANLLQGEEGSTAELVVVTPGQQPRRHSIQRRRVDVPSIDQVEIRDHDYGIGYLRLLCFQKTTSRDLDTAMWKLHREGMRSLIMDLRGNPGGLLLTSVEVADKFIERGTIVSTRGRSAQENFTYTAHTPGTWRIPLVVLIDEDSASAAEIFAGAIRDHRRGTIVGQRSYGKGSVQGIFPLDIAAAGVRLTTAKFYSPAGRPFSRIGVDPDVVVRRVAKPVDGQVNLPQGGGDEMLTAAMQAARQMGHGLQARNYH